MGVFTTASKTWAVGNKITASDLNGQLRDFINGFGAFTSYTPTVTGFTLGNGTVSGAYLQVNKLVIFRAQMVFGTTSAAASSVPTFTLPVTSVAVGTGSPLMLGTATFRDESAVAQYNALLRHVSTTTCAAAIPGTSGVYTVPSTTTPFTWTTSDVITMTGVYEAA